MGPITSIVPVVRVVPCGGRRFKVSELRLRDLARLQSVLDELEPDPFVAAQEAARGLPEAERLRIMGDAYDVAEAGPPVYGEERGRAFYATPEGGAFFLWVVLGRYRKITPAQAAVLYTRATAAEYGRIWRIAHGITPLQSIAQALLPPIPGGPSGGRAWPELICELAEETKWTLPQIYGMTISEWLFVRNSGRAPDVDRPILPGEDLAAIVAEQRRRVYGDAATITDTGGAAPTPN